jgi:hypothetical protein
MRFIVLHTFDEEPVFINIASIQHFWPRPNNYGSLINTSGKPVTVKESTTEIIQLIGIDYFNGSKSVKL